MSFDYDLFTIGAGSGGVRASRMAAAYGAKVAIAEEYRIGGTCVIRGCVPKKLMAYASQFSKDFEDAAGYGWTIEGAKFDWATLIANKDKEIERLSQIYRKNLGNPGVEIFETRAVLKDPHTVHLVGPDRDVTAARILIATGAAPLMPPEIEGVEHAVSSNEVFHLKTQPAHMTIVGAGYIAMEFAGIFQGLGSQVKLVHHGHHILRGFDEDLVLMLMAEMRLAGMELAMASSLARIVPEGGGFRCFLRDGIHFDTDLVMVATGRRPNTKNIGLETAGVTLDPNGAIPVDKHARSNVPHIFAIGDVTPHLQLTPIAIRQGAALAETLFNANPQEMDYENVPTAVFSSPPIGTVGLTEAQALERFGVLDIYKAAFRPMKNILARRETKTFMKIVVDAASERVLGVHLLGPEAPELIQAVAIAVKMGARKKDFDAAVAVHPTSAEELVLLRTKERVERALRPQAVQAN